MGSLVFDSTILRGNAVFSKNLSPKPFQYGEKYTELRTAWLLATAGTGSGMRDRTGNLSHMSQILSLLALPTFFLSIHDTKTSSFQAYGCE
jgi:hypothetical protein